MCTPLEHRGIRSDIINIISASWRESTKTQYGIYIKKWKHYCVKRGINQWCANVTDVLGFLSELFHGDNACYSTINQARSALSSFLSLTDSSETVGSHPLICRFLKGVFNLRTPKPRYKEIWDVGIMFSSLSSLRTFSPASSLSLRDLTFKLCKNKAKIAPEST